MKIASSPIDLLELRPAMNGSRPDIWATSGMTTIANAAAPP